MLTPLERVGVIAQHNAAFRLRITISNGPGTEIIASSNSATYLSTGTWRYDMVTLEAIPEPGTWVLIGLGLAVVLVRLRFSQCARTAIVGKDNLSRFPKFQPTPHSARRCGVFFWCEAVGIRLASLAAKVLAIGLKKPLRFLLRRFSLRLLPGFRGVSSLAGSPEGYHQVPWQPRNRRGSTCH